MTGANLEEAEEQMMGEEKVLEVWEWEVWELEGEVEKVEVLQNVLLCVPSDGLKQMSD